MSALPDPSQDPAAIAPPALPDPRPAILNAMEQCAASCSMAAADNPVNAEKLAKAVLELGQGFAALMPKPTPIPSRAFGGEGGPQSPVTVPKPPQPPRAPVPPEAAR